MNMFFGVPSLIKEFGSLASPSPARTLKENISRKCINQKATETNLELQVGVCLNGISTMT